jgi:hypothetical protein
MCIGEVVSGLFGMGSAKISGDAAKSAAKTEAAASKYAVDQSIQQQNKAAAEGRGYMKPYVDSGLQAYDLMQGAVGMRDPAAYETAYGQSYDKRVADMESAKAYEALKSSNAAAGKGGAINSGKAMRYAAETGNEIALGNRAAHYQKLAGFGQTGYDASTSSGNYGVGAAGVNSQALLQGAANQIQSSQYATGLRTDAIQSAGIAAQNALGGVAGWMNNKGPASSGGGNALGGTKLTKPRPTTVSPNRKIPGKI